MIGYRQFRRESIAAHERPSFWFWLRGASYQVRAQMLHALGRHTYQLTYAGPKPRRYCTWCGYHEPMM